jgi:hypothetical protein
MYEMGHRGEVGLVLGLTRTNDPVHGHIGVEQTHGETWNQQPATTIIVSYSFLYSRK